MYFIILCWHIQDTTLEGTKGNVSEALCSVLEDVSCIGCERGDGNRVVNPNRLLSALRKKCPQFEGGDQHDAHELLRHLLDTVRTEDLRVSISNIRVCVMIDIYDVFVLFGSRCIRVLQLYTCTMNQWKSGSICYY